MKYNIAIRIALLAIVGVILACGNSSSADLSRCIPASTQQIEIIRSGVKDIDANNDIKAAWAVKSKDFKDVWMVSAKIYGAGMESGTGPGIWAISGDPANPGITLSVNGYAKQFSTYPDANKTDAGITLNDDGVDEALKCASNN